MEALAARLDVVGLALNPTVRHKLQCAGFRTTADLAAVAGPVELATGALSAAGVCPPATATATSAAPAAACHTCFQPSNPPTRSQ